MDSRSPSRPTTRTPTAPSRTRKKIAQPICDKAGLDEDEIYKLIRGNAIRAFGLRALGHHPVVPGAGAAHIPFGTVPR